MGPRGQSERVWKGENLLSPPPLGGFEPLIVQLEAKAS